jgi:hypothetical protein
MRTLGRIPTIRGMFVSVLLLVLCLSGIVAIWICPQLACHRTDGNPSADRFERLWPSSA